LPRATRDIPSSLTDSIDPFQIGPDLDNNERWMRSGYLYMMKIINSIILQDIKKDDNANIDFYIINQKFEKFNKDPFGRFLSFVLPFFLVIAYVCPLCLVVFRMVKEKETRAKEGMKIMGMGDLVYFLSYFLQYLIINTFTCIINSMILSRILTMISFIYIFGFIWLFGMSIFSLGYFFQAIMDKTRIAMIISILIYFLMFFISAAVSSEDVTNFPKIILSLFPPTCLQLGVIVIAKFETSFLKFNSSQVSFRYQNYSVGNMYSMLIFDFFLYLFLGFYLENTLPHQFGISKPWYFLCTKGYWKKFNTSEKQIKEKLDMESRKIKNESNLEFKNEEMKNINIPHEQNLNNDNNKNDHFEDESKYETMIKEGKSLSIVNLKKKFGEKKKALDGLNLNFYKNEIFALLGHNGAGKSTLISILCGVYESDSGEAYYENTNILSSENVQKFRQKLGICPQHDVLFENLTVKEHLEMFCVFKGVDSKNIEYEVQKTMQEMCITDKKDTKSSGLSGGQKRKLSIGLALIGGSEVVFLDEPSSGMDITSRRQLWDILKNCMNNRIIVLTTHYMEEAAVLGNRIGILTNGKLKCCGSLLFLINKYGKYISLNVIKNPNANDKDIIDFISERIPDVKYEILSEEILFRINKNNSISLKDFFFEFDENMNKLNIKTYGASMPTLEDVYLNVASHKTMNDIVLSKKQENISNKEEKFNINKNNNIIKKQEVEKEKERVEKEKGKENENPEEIKNNSNNNNDNNDNYNNNNDIKSVRNNNNNKKIKYHEYDINDYEKITSGKKFFIDLKCSIRKRIIQIIRDKKSFMLEIICPILLCLIGLIVSSVEYSKDSPHVKLTPEILGIENENINLYSQVFDSKKIIPEQFKKFGDKITISLIEDKSNTNNNNINVNFNQALIDFNNKISPKEYKKDMNSYASYLIKDLNNNNDNNYSFALMSNSQSKDSMVIYAQFMMSKILSYAAGKEINVEVKTFI
jgi:ATP-binding cassette subfamily A (ABC1) protein 3